MKKISSAIFYGLVSLLLTIANKQILTIYTFPSISFIFSLQLAFTILILYGIGIQQGHTKRYMSLNLLKSIYPLPVIYFINASTGLMSTRNLSLPMFVALRRFTIIFTLIMEFMLLGIVPSRKICTSVVIMMFGSVFAASYDFSFDFIVYSIILINDAATTFYNVISKQKLENNQFSKETLIFYNSINALPLLLIQTFLIEDLGNVTSYIYWRDSTFLTIFTITIVFGYIYNISITLCTKYNSPLTTTVVGIIKNIITTYIGIMTDPDYTFNVPNCIGLHLSLFGAILYSYTVFIEKSNKVKQKSVDSIDVPMNLEKITIETQ
ncbi:Solute carrier family 35 member D2 [Intoshia linei]|uniref:Solute carrier family 35 member D2 n=1 Tax=Intoshia linei TaxID=1819745 RepID=A0A177BCE8_9BILA|nr:Solute carrier family 35 member D2 [Intoshia linei]